MSIALPSGAAAPSSRAAREPGEFEAWIGFGGNVGDRGVAIQRAVDALGPGVCAVSPIYETAPWGVLDQGWFLNGVLRMHWEGSAMDLLGRCLDIERSLGRIRSEKNGPRVIDLDVLVVGPGRLEEPQLVLPHPGIASRRSVLEPWAHLAPELLIPGTERTVAMLRDAAESLDGQEVRALS